MKAVHALKPAPVSLWSDQINYLSKSSGLTKVWSSLKLKALLDINFSLSQGQEDVTSHLINRYFDTCQSANQPETGNTTFSTERNHNGYNI